MAPEIEKTPMSENRVYLQTDPVSVSMRQPVIPPMETAAPAEYPTGMTVPTDRPVLPSPSSFSAIRDGKNILDNLAVILVLFHQISNQLRTSQIQEITNLAVARSAELHQAADKKKEASQKLLAAAIAGIVLTTVSAALSVAQVGTAAKASKAAPTAQTLREAKDAQKAASIGTKMKNLETLKTAPPKAKEPEIQVKPTDTKPDMEKPEISARTETQPPKSDPMQSGPEQKGFPSKEGPNKTTNNDSQPPKADSDVDSDSELELEESQLKKSGGDPESPDTAQQDARMKRYTRKLEELGAQRKDGESAEDFASRLDQEAQIKVKESQKGDNMARISNVMLSSQQTATIMAGIPGQVGQAQSSEKQAEGDEITADAEKTKAHEDLANAAMQAYTETAQTIRQLLGEMIQADYQAKAAIAKI